MHQIKPTMYVFVRKDLSFSQIAVQASHAVLEAARKYPNNTKTPYIIMYSVPDEKTLRLTLDSVKREGILVAEFIEPDRNNELTAFATSIQPDRIATFKRFELLR